MADVLLTEIYKTTSTGEKNTLYPKTHEKAVVTSDGTRLDVVLTDIKDKLATVDTENYLTKTEQTLTPEEQAQTQTNIGVKDTVDVVGAEPIQKLEYTIWKDGYYRNDVGNIIQTNGYIISNAIKVNIGDRIRYRAFGGTSVANFTEIINNDEHTFIRVVFKGASSQEYQEFIADKEMYVEFCGQKIAMDSFIYIQKSKINSTVLIPQGGYNRTLFEAVGAIFNQDKNSYTLNGIELTENEMAASYEFFNFNKFDCFSKQYFIPSNVQKLIKTNIPSQYVYSSISSWNWSLKFAYLGALLPNLEKVVFNRFNDENNEFLIVDNYVGCDYLLYSCSKLKEIIGVINLSKRIKNGTYSYLLSNCPLLEKVKIKGLNDNWEIKQSPLLNYESLKYVIDNATNNKAITITVHPTTYSYLMNSSEPSEQVGGTSEDWQTLVTLAQEKQISFASA